MICFSAGAPKRDRNSERPKLYYHDDADQMRGPHTANQIAREMSSAIGDSQFEQPHPSKNSRYMNIVHYKYADLHEFSMRWGWGVNPILPKSYKQHYSHFLYICMYYSSIVTIF